ncbi:class I SAM-dependent methyltransferase [Chelativorans salis]|uniref:Class I SAM-dependent methyltransferase n=1 Tax=Chelativorans salis TaxID=2978478 RepID=A0ABT2LP56_9HYPH|nr:class I SAM-dependent methyltransferase [Chelativorans sp. EGI FJ00035]MCT7375839.1 class I SAM-dependent methyltransferase [Chelativorans sp. EGI FJ00035]
MSATTKDHEHWAKIAADWIAWARTPNHDAFWAYRQAFASFVGKGGGRALDVGCGEGRVSRELKACGYHVTAADPVEAFIEAAAGLDSADEYVVAAATHLPLEDGHFDLVVSYNVLMDVDDVPAAVREMRRVLRPEGRLVVSIVHPFFDHGRFAGPGGDAPFIVEGSYFGRQRFDETVEERGLKMHFSGWSQPLEAYAAALEGAGLAITSIREPLPDLGEGRQHMERWTRMPLFLWFTARPLAG